METLDTISVGGGQAGLAAAYHMLCGKHRSVILEAGAQPGGRWTQYYASLQLFSPARFSLLSGMLFMGTEALPSRTEMLTYLWSYAARVQIPIVTNTRVASSEKGHGRLETRSLVSGNAHIEDIDWPGIGQLVCRSCERIERKSGKVTHEVNYGLTSLTPQRAGATDWKELWRGHWTIENRVHYVRDVTFGEDGGHAAAGNTARALASTLTPSRLTHYAWSAILAPWYSISRLSIRV